MPELAVLVLSVIFLMVRGIWIAYASNRNEERQSAALAALLDPMIGGPIANAIARFGQPTDYVPGTTGRALYIWVAPPAKRFPPGQGVLVVTLTVGGDGTISDVKWVARAT